MGGEEGSGPRVIVRLIRGLAKIVRGEHQLHDPPSIDVDAAISRLWEDLVDKPPGRVWERIEDIDA